MTSQDDRERINSLLDSIFQNPFAKSRQLFNLSVEQAGEMLEQERAALDDDAESSDEVKAQIEQCLADYCLLLLELEVQASGDYSQDTLADLRHRGTGTQLFTLPKKPEGQAPEASQDLVLNDFSIESLLQEDPLPETPPVQSAPEAPREAKSSVFPAHHFPDDIWGEAEKTDPGDRAENINPPTMEMERPKFNDTPAPVVAAETPTTEVLPSEEVTTEKDIKSILDQMDHSTDPSWMSKRAQEYWKVQSFFSSGGSELSDEFRWRFQTLASCATVEAECGNRFLTSLRNMWPGRKGTVVHLSEFRETKFVFEPTVKDALQALAEENLGLLFESKFPLPGITNSFRYLLSVDDPNKWRPTLLDFGVVLFFMGQNRPFGGRSTKNFLEIQGWVDSEISEVFFLLLRLNKLKSRCLDVMTEFSQEHRDMVHRDTERVLQLLKKCKVPDSSQVFQVA